MTARLCVHDQDGERTVDLHLGEAIVLGRGEGATLRLHASGVSHQHARIERDADGWRVRDLGSRNGVLIDGEPVSVRLLRHGDRLAVGEAEIVYLEQETSEQIAEPTPESKAQSDALLRAAQRILAADLDLARLLALVMDVVIVETGAARGFVVLSEGDELAFYAARNLEGKDLSSPEFQLSRTVVREVIRGGAPVIVQDAAEDQRFQGGESVQRLGLRSVLAVPLRSGGAGGALYLDDPRRRDRFSAEDAVLVSGVAELVSRPLEHARTLARAREELQGRQRLGAMVSRSACMQELFGLLRRAASSRAPLLVVGESGTGKELVARAVHAEGESAAGPFVAVNVAAIPETLLDSELFGHEEGAFTGADKARAGLFREAGEGTLFLDEIEEMSDALQAKLLRVLQEGVVRSVGGSEEVPVHGRIIAATNEDPLELVRGGLLREDLYYRLAVLVVRVPPLRERREDVPLLVEQFLARAGGRTIEPEAVGLLASHAWPGNVRELENRVRELTVVSTGSITRGDVEQLLARERTTPLGEHEVLSLAEAKERFERQLVSAALARARGNIAGAGRELKVDRSQLHRVCRRLGLNPASFREEADP